MKTKTLFFCPQDADVLLFEEVYDERLDFVYQPLHELPRVCPRCGRMLYKGDCLTVEELYAAEDPCQAAGA
jgi:hypothetical protein